MELILAFPFCKKECFMKEIYFLSSDHLQNCLEKSGSEMEIKYKRKDHYNGRDALLHLQHDPVQPPA